ncbi:hypothetical protein RIR_jg21849.t1 [Rhizophagus irregularis DAOM 181602=DAOM 197198]|nr:hypothetical protein RIR_jg21849.t1 [Rhizophagus irregularis DAOM 181602=DAOM 197198]
MKGTDGIANRGLKIQRTKVFNDLYNTGKELWAKYQDASDDYDWEILAFEVKECPTTRIENEYQYYLREVVDRFKDWIEYNGYLPKTPSRKELTDLIRVYKDNRDAEIIPTPSGYETMRADKVKRERSPRNVQKPIWNVNGKPPMDSSTTGMKRILIVYAARLTPFNKISTS